MTEEPVKRKLTAILSADVKGYSRLMADDEEATVTTINTYREVMTSLIAEHHGRVVDAKGDNLLAEFASVVDAVRCSVNIQRELKKRNADLATHRKMEFRIGVNLGDVIEEKETIYGDGVNVAARLEGLADAGGLCISGTAFDQVRDKLNLGYEYLGEQSVKNIPRPIRAYKVLMEEEHAGKVIGEEKLQPKQWRWAGIGAVAILIMVAGIFAIWNFYLRPDVEPASVEKMAFPLPEKPSIAVLPFDNMSGDPNEDYFSDGITENIITALSSVRNLFVISRNSTFTYKDKPVKVQQVAEDLGVQYVLEGGIQKTKDRIRITAQLIDALNGKHLWAERYDRELKDIFAIQDEVTLKIISALQVELTEGEGTRVIAERGTKNLEAYLKILHAAKHMQNFNKEEVALARKFTEEALSLDPEYAFAYANLAAVNVLEVYIGASKSPKESLDRAEELAKKALSLDDSLFYAHSQLALAYVFKRQFDKALLMAEKAVAFGPNSDFTHFMLGTALMHSERFEEAIPHFKKSLRLRPHPFSQALNNLANTYRFLGRYDEAIATYKKMLQHYPDHLNGHLNLAATYVLAGRQKEAEVEAAEVMRIDPKFFLKRYAKMMPYRKALVDELVQAWRKAGLPETPPLPLPDKPSIAVLPFTNMSGDPEQEYFSDGITEEIITALSKTPKLFVIARNSTFTYKGKPTKVQQVGRELGVKYVLEGSVRKAGEKVRITAQLVDAQTGNHLWAERYDRELKDIFAIQDEIAMEIMAALQIKLTEGAAADLKYHGTKHLEAYEKILMAKNHLYRRTKEDVRLGQQFVKEALDIDSEYNAAYRTMGWLYLDEVWFGMTKSPAKSIEKAQQMAEKATSLRGYQTPDYCLLSSINLLKKDFDHAIEYGEKAVKLGPNDSRAHFIFGMALRYAGQYKEAISEFEKAIRLDPITPINRLNNLGWAYLLAKEYESAILIFNKAIQRNPDYLFAYMGLTATYNLSGDIEKSHWAAENVLRVNPQFSLDAYEKRSPIKIKEDKKRIISAMRDAGLK